MTVAIPPKNDTPLLSSPKEPSSAEKGSWANPEKRKAQQKPSEPESNSSANSRVAYERERPSPKKNEISSDKKNHKSQRYEQNRKLETYTALESRSYGSLS